MEYYSPLRYPGGKGKVADYFKRVFKENLLYDGVYVEPYAGGASVGLSLLFNEYASKIIINDIDVSIYAFWHSVLYDTDQLLKLISDTPVNVSTWSKQKLIQKHRSDYDYSRLGFSTFFLNRTNRSGILNAGIIGGREQAGVWKIDARYNKKELANRIMRIAEYRERIELYNEDAAILIPRLAKSLPAKSLFYFDPPYYIKGKDLYLNYYKIEDHVEIAMEVSRVQKQKWIVTYDNVPSIRNLYKSFRQRKYTLNYSASEATTGEEVMIFSANTYIARHPMLQRKK